LLLAIFISFLLLFLVHFAIWFLIFTIKSNPPHELLDLTVPGP
jgi:hypothetical protein